MGEQKHLPFPQLVGSAAGFLVTLMEPCRSDLEKNLQGYNERSNHQAEELTCFLCCKKMKPLFCVENWEISGVFQCFFFGEKNTASPKNLLNNDAAEGPRKRPRQGFQQPYWIYESYVKTFQLRHLRPAGEHRM